MTSPTTDLPTTHSSELEEVGETRWAFKVELTSLRIAPSHRARIPGQRQLVLGIHGFRAARGGLRREFVFGGEFGEERICSGQGARYVTLGVLALDGLAGEWVDLLFRVQHEICGSNERIGQINEIIQDTEVWPSSRFWQIR